MIDDKLALAIDLLDRCRCKSWRIGTAESCTGGLIAGALTAPAGASDVVEGGFVTYSNAAKIALLGVPADLFDRVGAVSPEVACAMAEGALARLPAAALTISVTGIAGPGGGSTDKPVGLVYFGIARCGADVESHKEIFPGDRAQIRHATVLRALALLRDAAG